MSDWVDVPVDTDTDIQDHEWLTQFWRALRERQCAINGIARWPRHNQVWDEGVVGAITATTLTDSSKTWTPLPSCGSKRWTGVDCTDAPWVPASYDVIINCDDSDLSKIVRASISDNTTTVLTISDISDYVTAGFLSSLSDLVGKQYAIIKRDGLWWSDRWLTFPNDFEAYKGTATSGVYNSYLTDTSASFGNVVGKDVLVYASDGRLKRQTVVCNNGHTLYFNSSYCTSSSSSGMSSSSASGLTLSGPYIVVESGGKGFPSRVSDAPFAWYRGAMDSVLTRLPDGSVGGTTRAATNVDFETGTPPDCDSTPHDALDIDVWSALEEECSEAEKCYSPDIYKSLRMLQQTVEFMTQYFVAPISYDGKKSIDNFVPATLFAYCGINSATTTASVSSGSVTFTYTPATGADYIYLGDQRRGRRSIIERLRRCGRLAHSICLNRFERLNAYARLFVRLDEIPPT